MAIRRIDVPYKPTLQEAVEKARWRDGKRLSQQALAAEWGVSISTARRVLYGEKVHSWVAERILSWLGYELPVRLTEGEQPASGWTLDRVITLRKRRSRVA
jgi:hypothetical protein